MKPPLKNKLIIIHWNKFCHALFMDHKKYFYLFFISAIAGFISSCTDENELITRDKYIGTWTNNNRDGKGTYVSSGGEEKILSYANGVKQ